MYIVCAKKNPTVNLSALNNFQEVPQRTFECFETCNKACLFQTHLICLGVPISLKKMLICCIQQLGFAIFFSSS